MVPKVLYSMQINVGCNLLSLNVFNIFKTFYYNWAIKEFLKVQSYQCFLQSSKGKCRRFANVHINFNNNKQTKINKIQNKSKFKIKVESKWKWNANENENESKSVVVRACSICRIQPEPTCSMTASCSADAATTRQSVGVRMRVKSYVSHGRSVTLSSRVFCVSRRAI